MIRAGCVAKEIFELVFWSSAVSSERVSDNESFFLRVLGVCMADCNREYRSLRRGELLTAVLFIDSYEIKKQSGYIRNITKLKQGSAFDQECLLGSFCRQWQLPNRFHSRE